MKLAIRNKKFTFIFDGRYENPVCHYFNHKWIYYCNADSPQKQIRMCTRCHLVQEYKSVIIFGLNQSYWSNLIQRTSLGAKEWITGSNIKTKEE